MESGTAYWQMQYSLDMKSIVVMRHGKSDWNTDYASDHDRPLATRGAEAAALMGRFLSRINQQPAEIISSTAVRARATADLAAAAGHWQCPTTYTESLYGATVPEVLDLLRAADDETSSVLVVGHQPCWSALIAELTGGGSIRFPTAALARIDLDIDGWSQVREYTGALRWLVTPKLLQRAGL